MEQEKLLEELLQLLEKLNIIVRYNSGIFQGGLVKYNSQDYFYLNRKSEIEVKINTIAAELKQMTIPEELKTETIRNILDPGDF